MATSMAMESLDNDCLESLLQHLDLASAERFVLSDKRTHAATNVKLRDMRASALKFLHTYRTVVHCFQRAQHDEDLDTTLKRILGYQSESDASPDPMRLSVSDVLFMEVLLETDVHVRGVIVGTHKGRAMTLGDVVDNLQHATPVRAWIGGYAHPLKIYVSARASKFLPHTAEGTFFSWGFAERVGGVGSYEHAVLLTHGALHT